MKKNKVLVVAVHPDDETLGCGGTLLRHRQAGDEIIWLIVTCMKREDGFTSEQIKERDGQIQAVGRKLGVAEIVSLDISAVKVDRVPMSELIGSVAKVFKKINPTILYLPFRGDVHSDHRKFFDAVFSCTKSFRFPSIRKVLMMETISETEFAPSIPSDAFVPNHFVDVSKFLAKKLEIMKIYKSELGKHPFPRSIENIKALATFRGAMAGCRYAESFMLLKEIV
ncbi:MAG: GlcNAc-PI de-N-acetylase [Omnitrophica WOR_2 bacterium GWA2_47_8]|nr:MAG: GlcNAc-PI de-N-acetylase [Omnitrophica WOR_2 bacterium GWA2_47_8]